jgi:hypothetical protein
LEKIEIKLSTGKVVELRGLTAKEQMNADMSAGGDPSKLIYYRIAMAVAKIDGEPPIKVVADKGPRSLEVITSSSLHLDQIIDRFNGSEIDALQNIYRLKFAPFMAVAMKAEYQDLTAEQLAEDPLLAITELVLQLDITGHYLVPLSSGREAELRAITAREQMCSDSWANGDATRVSYFRAVMAIARLGDEDFEPAQSAKDLETRIGLLSGLDADEIGFVYNQKYSARGEILKNESSPPSSDSSQTQ